jgi:hypothetical protein
MKMVSLCQLILPSGSRCYINVCPKLLIEETNLFATQESQVYKDGLTVYKRFVLFPDTNSINTQRLNLHLPTGHIYSVKNDHCTTSGCSGMFNAVATMLIPSIHESR